MDTAGRPLRSGDRGDVLDARHAVEGFGNGAVEVPRGSGRACRHPGTLTDGVGLRQQVPAGAPLVTPEEPGG